MTWATTRWKLGERLESLHGGRANEKIRLGDKTFEVAQSRIGLEPIADGNEGQRYLLSVQFETDDLIRRGTSCTVLVVP